MAYGMEAITMVIVALLVVVWLALFIAPFSIIHRRLGLSGWWSLMVFIPYLGGLILLWVVALRRWPIDDELDG